MYPVFSISNYKDDSLVKSSIFVWYRNDVLHNDLTARAYKCIPEMVLFLKLLAEKPARIRDIRHEFPCGNELVEFAVQERLVVPYDYDEGRDFYPCRVDIETVRHCNARCRFCPQSEAPKPNQVMSMEQFEKIVGKIAPYSPDWAGINHYGEPLLDPHFRNRVKLLREARINLHLFTNATLLSDSLVDFIGNDYVHGVVFNFPSLDPDEWCDLMQMHVRMYWRARNGIEQYLARYGTGSDFVTIAVNAYTGNRDKRARRIFEHFSSFGKVSIRIQDTNSRAGSVANTLVRIRNRSEEAYFAGCERITAHLHIAWDGRVYLCCNDYEQRVVLGDINQADIAEIMQSDEARDLRAEIYGLAKMRSSRLCMNCTMLRENRFS